MRAHGSVRAMTVVGSEPTSPHGVRLTVRDFMLLSDSGAFDCYSKSELIDGEILCVNAQFARHSGVKSEVAFELERALRRIGSPLRVYVEVAVEVDEHTLLEPDIVVSTYRGAGAVPATEAVLVVEVADTTLHYDLNRKTPRYAAAGIGECWVVDLTGQKLCQFWQPVGGRYTEQRTLHLGERIDAATIAGVSVETRAV